MNCSRKDAANIASYLAEFIQNACLKSSDVVICPPSILIDTVMKNIFNSNIKLGGQDCHINESGAFTGDISAAMLKDAGCEYVIIGHSERRQFHKETNEIVAKKVIAALKNGLHPIICVGETEEERRNGTFYEVLPKQVIESLPQELFAEKSSFTIAYEPVWAIGSGLTPTTDNIVEAHIMIRKALSAVEGKFNIVYGGSVKGANALEILSLWQVDGVLVGGASLNPSEFASIISASEQAVEGE